MSEAFTGPRPAPSVRRAFTLLAAAELAGMAKNRRSLLWTTAVPVAILVLDVSQVSGRAPTQELWSFVAWAAVMGAFVLGLLGYSTDLVGYRERGVFRRLRTTPVPASLILVVRGMAALVAILIEFLVVVTVAMVAYHVHPTVATVTGGLGAVALGGLSAVALAQVIVARTARAQSATALARLVLIVSFFLNGTFIRLQVWPVFWQHVAEWTPVRLADGVLVPTLQGQSWGPTVWHYAAGLTAWIVVTGVVGVVAFRWEGGDR
ncbi:MAG: ABC transporter permease [Thermaerobacter sp.]|nr:ABC transporter permease [Thermaerobacter sp.]